MAAHRPRYPTFATVAADGTPEARTVALRAASRSLSTLEVHTDIATAKVVALKHFPASRFSLLVATCEFTNSDYNDCRHPDGVSCWWAMGSRSVSVACFLWH